MNTMVGCKQTRKLIDEADNPESLSFEASNHVATCARCETFAAERARLRSLLVSGPRITVPMNFDAVLKARLAEAKSRSAFAWLSPAGYLRLGGATAALAVMVFGAQYSGLFEGSPSGPQQGTVATRQVEPSVGAPSQPAPQPPVIVVPGERATVSAVNKPGRRAPLYYEASRVASVRADVPREDYLHEDGGVMLVRGPNGEGEVSLPMVSVGAQSMVYATAGTSRRPARSVGTSFWADLNGFEELQHSVFAGVRGLAGIE